MREQGTLRLRMARCYTLHFGEFVDEILREYCSELYFVLTY